MFKKKIVFVSPPVQVNGDLGTLSNLYSLNNHVGGIMMKKRSAPIPLDFLLIGLDRYNFFSINIYEYGRLYHTAKVSYDDDQFYIAYKLIDNWVDRYVH